MALTVDDRLIDATRGDTIVSRGVNARKTFVVAQVQIRLHTIDCHIALTMLVGVQRSWVDVDIRVELLDGDFIATCLQQLTDAGGNDALTQGRDHTARNKNVFSFHMVGFNMPVHVRL